MDGFEIGWLWAIGLMTFLIGIAAGIAIGYLGLGNRRREQELEEKLDTLQQESDAYRQQVSQHFLRSSELVQKMTDSYREVYEHLATGSQALCQDPVTTPRLDIPETPRLETTSDETPAAEEPVKGFSDAETDTSEEAALDEVLGDAPKVPSLETENMPTDETGKPRIH